ncbi:receptor-like protein EIX2 [Neltuma alba]|uniref:receptor-like protein EIX2 n=1 Tax=Neltuma alba TaxID=207710 RepID=UPI0010A4D223|nr:receptor-like protein EIX2 [Prosopis alba]
MDGSCNIVVVVFLWLLTLSNVDLCICRTSYKVQCLPSERDALLKMKSHLSDPSNRLASWSLHANCCSWASVVWHNITGHVLELHLTTPPPSQFNGDLFYGTLMFGGQVHSSLLDLKHLDYLDLSNNDFGGMHIPGFLGSMTSLTYLNLSNAGFGGSIPLQFWNLSNLIYLDLGSNHLEGSIPHQIGKLSNLQYLALGGNEFNGSIPHQIGNFSNLQYLDLGDNQFSGRTPHQIGNLSNLINLHLGFVENLQWIAALSSLQHLELSSLNLSNTFDWFQVLHSLPSLRELHLLECDFNHHFEPSIINFSSLAVLHLSDSYFHTSLIPNWVFQLKRLVHLQLNNNSFQGPIPVGIQNLTLLQHLDLSDNQFNSYIPDWLYSFSHLKSLILSQNYLVGTISMNVGNLTSLVTLDLHENYLEGSIPISVGNLCNLKKLDISDMKCNQQISQILKILLARCVSHALEIFHMSGSQLSGHLIDQIGLFKNLIALDLSSNSIQGPIPNSLGNLASLKYLDLFSNSIKGALPSSFGNLTSLMSLTLNRNQLEGNPFEILGLLCKLIFLILEHNLFQGVVKEAHLVNFTRLQILSVERNQLTLKVDPNWNPSFQLLEVLALASSNSGPHFPSWIQSLKYLSHLDISDNNICDSIPTWLWGMVGNLDYLNLSHNHIEGELSNMLINTFSEGAVDLNSNKLHGQLPYVSQNTEYLDLSSNWFSGSITRFLCHKQEETGLLFLNLASNNLSGKVPDCWARWPYLEVVNLGNNHFTGILHTSMSSLPWLKMLNLRNNTFSGNFLSFLKNRRDIVCLDLGENQFSGMIPSWVGQSLSSLKILVLRSNKFFGPIPYQICDLSVLQILDLADNELTGHLPKCINHLSAMLVINNSLESHISFDLVSSDLWVVEPLLLKERVYDYSSNLGLVTSIDFSNNRLSGEIPTELPGLKGLHFLNLSNNDFIGKIPQNIGNMESLETMDFSRNHLTGEIPPSMSKLSFLSMLNLSHNNLTGKIPTGTQIQSFEASSFVGNYDLCGPPLNNSCSSNSSSSKEEEVPHVKGINWFFVSMAFGFIVGFWIVVGPLLYSSSWRYAYFQFIDRMWYKLQYSSYR